MSYEGVYCLHQVFCIKEKDSLFQEVRRCLEIV
jgi:hypothetical protein